MAAVLHRQGILLSPSPNASPYTIPASLPATPHLISSFSSLSSTSSSSSPHAEPDNYFLASTSTQRPSVSPLNNSNNPRSDSAASTTLASRRIRFAPLPDPRREVLVTEEGKELPLPPVFIDEADESCLQAQPHILNLRDGFVAAVEVGSQGHSGLDRASNPNPPSSLLFSNTPNGIALVEALPSPHFGEFNGVTQATFKASQILTESVSDQDSDRDASSPSTITTASTDPTSTSARSSSTSSLPHSPAELDVSASPKLEKKSWTTRKLLRPLFGRNSSKDNLASYGEDDEGGLSRSESRGSVKKGAVAQKKVEAPLPPLDRVQSDNTITGKGIKRPVSSPAAPSTSASTSTSIYPPLHQIPMPRPANPNPHQKPRTLFSSPTATSLSLSLFNRSSGSANTALGRTQSLTTDLRRVQSGGSVKSTKSLNSALGGGKQKQKMKPSVSAQGVRRGQLKMLNGRVYGARRLDPFANVRYVSLLSFSCLHRSIADVYYRNEEPEFVEWGFGGMGSNQNHLHSSEGNIWAKVQSSSGMAIGALQSESWGSRSGSVTGSGESERSTRGRVVEDDDDGSGMAWVKRRREMKEKEKLQSPALVSASQEVCEEKEEKEGATTPTSSTFDAASHAQPLVASETEHVTTAVTLPPTRSHSVHHHHRNLSTGTIQPQPLASPESGAATPRVGVPVPERRSSADTARGVPVPLPLPLSSAVAEGGEGFFGEKTMISAEPEQEGVKESGGGSGSGSGSTTGSDEDEGSGGDESESDEDDEVRSFLPFLSSFPPFLPFPPFLRYVVLGSNKKLTVVFRFCRRCNDALRSERAWRRSAGIKSITPGTRRNLGLLP